MIDPAASLSLTVQRNILLVPFKGINAGNIIPHAVILHIAGRYYVVSVIDGKQDFFIIPVRREERPKWPLPLSFFFSPRAAFHLPGVPALRSAKVLSSGLQPRKRGLRPAVTEGDKGREGVSPTSDGE